MNREQFQIQYISNDTPVSLYLSWLIPVALTFISTGSQMINGSYYLWAPIIYTKYSPGLYQLHMNSSWPWASCQIRKIAGCACAGNAGNVFPCRQFQRKPLVSDPGMHHGTCVTHVPWCMSGSLTCDDGENVPGIPGACAPAILRIWQEAHAV